MNEASYIRRRDEIRVYFDRTALDAWKKLTGDAKVSRIRETVRAGRERMRNSILSHFPQDLAGWRILDAGCGAGPLSVELAGRGARVTGVDLSAEMIAHARENLPRIEGAGAVELLAGDMLALDLGRFDAVVAMDSLIHYRQSDALNAVARLALRTRSKIVFTVAPRTLPLTLMHAAGKLFPRGDRSPAIVPVDVTSLAREIASHPAMAGWQGRPAERVESGFYISQAVEVSRQ
jgi:magnesium-protoporphyrin O-methyltransferase